MGAEASGQAERWRRIRAKQAENRAATDVAERLVAAFKVQLAGTDPLEQLVAAFTAAAGRPRVDPERWIREGHAGLAAIAGGQRARAERNWAARERGRQAWEAANASYYGSEPVQVAASASWLWGGTPPMQIF